MSSTYNKHESKYFNTAQLMDEALLKLLEEKEYDYITISELCKKAGVNRSTFYLHYRGMDDLLKETLIYSNEKFNNYFKKLSLPDLRNAMKEKLIFICPEYLIPYLNYIKNNKKLFLIAKSKPELFNVNISTNEAEKNVIFPILERFNVPKNEMKFTAVFYMKGVEAVVLEWVKNDCKESIEYITNLIIKFVVTKD